jgi:hypothetical protein
LLTTTRPQYFGLLLFWFRRANERGRQSKNYVYPMYMFAINVTYLIGDVSRESVCCVLACECVDQ